MANRDVWLAKRVQTPKGLRYCRAQTNRNGRVRSNYVRVAAAVEHHPEGSYYICWREGARQRRLCVGRDALEADIQRRRKEAELSARNHGVEVVEQIDARPTVAAASAAYLEEIQLTKKPKTYAAYSLALRYFAESCPKIHLDEIARADLLRFSAFLRETKKQAPRSVANKFENVCSFLKAQDVRLGLTKQDWPRYTEETPEIYSEAEREALFATCTPEERLWFTFFLQTGMREQEVMHCEWSDVDLSAGVVRVSHKPQRGWQPKAYKEREIPVPDTLVERLRAHKNGHALVFSSEAGSVKRDFLHCLKRVAKRAGLEPANFWLHKFRATFATLHLWAGVDLRTVQSWLGHSDLASTFRYLKPAHGAEVRAKVNATFA